MGIVSVKGSGEMKISGVKALNITGKVREGFREHVWVLQIVMIALIAFSVTRVSLIATFYPCSIAMMAASLRKSTLNLYLMFPVVISFVLLIPGSENSTYFISSLAAMLLCTAFFMATTKKNYSDFSRMIVCAFVSLATNVAYFIATDTVYMINGSLILLDAVTVCALYFVFHVFFALFDWKREFVSSPESGVSAISAVWTLTFTGIFQEAEGMLSGVPVLAVLFGVLVIGYKLGVYAGVTAAAVSSVTLLLTGVIVSSHVVIIICAGVAAGLFSGLNKYTTTLCFTAVCLVFGLTCSGSLGAFPKWPPLASGILFVLMPSSLSFALTKFLRRLAHTQEGISDVRTDDILKILERYRKCFGQLGSLYNLGLDKRSIVSHQFRGMERVIDKLEEDIKTAGNGRITPVSFINDTRYRIETQASGYARSGSISGDSYITRRISGNKYLMILCDGMGKGEAASLESNLAVKTLSNLIDAGFETELALHTLNSILLLKSKEEIFSTVDIGIFDCEKAVLKLYKIGAASTYIKRGNRVDAVKMATLPMGIVDGLKIDYVSVKLQDGDQIIMVSDGITDSGRYAGSIAKCAGAEDVRAASDTMWLDGLIANVKSKDPGTMADLIVSSAIENYGLRERDDLTVISAVVRSK
ncbi:MAG: SpoIIE family protein phosphatase [Firmicutes bacterium]|nr:SpoIIE family protein phosphatase [Bacillota bacterium]